MTGRNRYRIAKRLLTIARHFENAAAWVWPHEVRAKARTTLGGIKLREELANIDGRDVYLVARDAITQVEQLEEQLDAGRVRAIAPPPQAGEVEPTCVDCSHLGEACELHAIEPDAWWCHDHARWECGLDHRSLDHEREFGLDFEVEREVAWWCPTHGRFEVDSGGTCREPARNAVGRLVVVGRLAWRGEPVDILHPAGGVKP